MIVIQNNNLTGEKDSLDFLEARLDPTKNILHEGHLPSCALVQVTIFPLLDKITRWQPRNQDWHWWVGWLMGKREVMLWKPLCVRRQATSGNQVGRGLSFLKVCQHNQPSFHPPKKGMAAPVRFPNSQEGRGTWLLWSSKMFPDPWLLTISDPPWMLWQSLFVSTRHSKNLVISDNICCMFSEGCSLLKGPVAPQVCLNTLEAF